MTRQEYLALWRTLSPAEKRGEILEGVGDLLGGFVLVGMFAIGLKYLPVITAVFWALLDLIP